MFRTFEETFVYFFKHSEPDCSGFLLKQYTSLIYVKEKLFSELNEVDRKFLPKSENDLLLSLSRKEDERSSHQRFSVKKGVLRNFAKFTGKHLCHMDQACNFIKKETPAQVFSCAFCEISKKTFLQYTFGRLLLMIKKQCIC